MDFWEVHDRTAKPGTVFFLFFFPRLTMLWGMIWGTIVSGGFLWWLGWVVCPRLLIAILATTYYWDTNPVLCVFAWLFAFCGESAEKKHVSSSRIGGREKVKVASA